MKIKITGQVSFLKKANLYYLLIIVEKNYEKIAEKAFTASSAAM